MINDLKGIWRWLSATKPKVSKFLREVWEITLMLIAVAFAAWMTVAIVHLMNGAK